MNIDTTTGAAISARRSRMGLSQSDLAKAAGMSVDWLSRVERGIAENVSGGAFLGLLVALGSSRDAAMEVISSDGDDAAITAAFASMDSRMSIEEFAMIAAAAKIPRRRRRQIVKVVVAVLSALFPSIEDDQ